MLMAQNTITGGNHYRCYGTNNISETALPAALPGQSSLKNSVIGTGQQNE